VRLGICYRIFLSPHGQRGDLVLARDADRSSNVIGAFAGAMSAYPGP
jgi:hypothetical protein